jgi:hypothetical protein
VKKTTPRALSQTCGFMKALIGADDRILECGVLANLCGESRPRELLEQ